MELHGPDAQGGRRSKRPSRPWLRRRFLETGAASRRCGGSGSGRSRLRGTVRGVRPAARSVTTPGRTKREVCGVEARRAGGSPAARRGVCQRGGGPRAASPRKPHDRFRGDQAAPPFGPYGRAVLPHSPPPFGRRPKEEERGGPHEATASMRPPKRPLRVAVDATGPPAADHDGTARTDSGGDRTTAPGRCCRCGACSTRRFPEPRGPRPRPASSTPSGWRRTRK